MGNSVAFRLVNGEPVKVQARPYYPERPGLVDYLAKVKFPNRTDTTKGRSIINAQHADMRLMAHYLTRINPDGEWAENDNISRGCTRAFAGHAIMDLVAQREASVTEQVPSAAAKQYTGEDTLWARVLMDAIADKAENDPLWGVDQELQLDTCEVY